MLAVNEGRADLHAPTVVGVIRGLETLLQLVAADSAGPYLPAVTIEDHPRFRWRGLLIDVCRHWEPVAVIERTLDAMATVKLNVLHWHLSEDQGFRVESRRYPRLQGLGSDGLYYTQAQIREVTAYARDRGIRVVPEFDMPAHSTSWFVGYPQYAAAPGPYQIEREFGVHDAVFDPTREAVYAFIDALNLFGIGPSWGGFESLAIPFDCTKIRTATKWMPRGPTVRLHIGLEDVDDLIGDLERGFAALAAAR